MYLRIVTVLGGPMVRTIVVIETVLLFLFVGRRRQAMFLIATVGGSGLLNTVLKHVIGRKRPRSFFGLLDRSPSFPSGHTNGTVALTGSFCLLLWRRTRNPALVALCAVACASWSGLVGYSRVKLHQHHTGDVVAGYTLGLLWLAVSAAVTRKVALGKRTS